MKKFLMIMTVALFSVPAFAVRNGDVTNASIRQEMRLDSKIKMQGALTCNLGAENNGQACALRIKDKTTGKTFNLVENKAAMRLFHEGYTQVSITGTMYDSQTIQVAEVNAL